MPQFFLQSNRMYSKIQDKYTDALNNLGADLESSYNSMRQQCVFDKGFDYSQAIVARLGAFYSMQSEVKGFLCKSVAQSGSDFFVETIIFFLQLFNDVEGLGLEIKSEQTIQRKRNAMRPDITIWRGEELLAVIECKTQLGWHRHDWGCHFAQREERMKELFPNSQIFLVVMTGLNWPGFGSDERVGKQLFCLLKDVWPQRVKDESMENFLDTRIEELFEQIRLLSKTSQHQFN
jgi:hypothetical protein